MKRRQFLKGMAFTGAAGLILPNTRLFGADAPSNKLNIALVGTWGRGEAHFGGMATENVVALCDINEQHLAGAAKKFPEAKTYVDWRKMLDQKDIDAVICCTTDFTHAFVANWTMNRGKHIYCEKPLGNTVEEARVCRLNYLKNKDKLATQVGTQRHEIANFNRTKELVMDGAIGKLEEACAWGNRQVIPHGTNPPKIQGPKGASVVDIRGLRYHPAAGAPPSYLHYDLWLGPTACDHPYNPGYFALGSGANCLAWNMFWDFGSGQIGDMGSHTMDLCWNALDADLPTSAEAKGDPFNPDVAPIMLETHFDLPANSWRDAVKLSWYEGGVMPDSPTGWVDLHKIDHGAMWEGSQGALVAGFDNRLLVPRKQGDMTYYKPRTKDNLIPPLGNFQRQWINACKGGLKTSCNFDYSGKMTETMLLGLVAYRVGKKIKYDGAKGVTDDAEANKLLTREYRKGWTLNG